MTRAKIDAFDEITEKMVSDVDKAHNDNDPWAAMLALLRLSLALRETARYLLLKAEGCDE